MAVLRLALAVVVMAMRAGTQPVALVAVLHDVGHWRRMLAGVISRVVMRLDLRNRERTVAARKAKQRRIVLPGRPGREQVYGFASGGQGGGRGSGPGVT